MPGLRTCCNLPPTREDEFVKNALGATSKGSGTLTPTPTIFYALTPTPAQPSALALAQGPAPAPTISSTNKLYQQLMKMYTAIVKLLEQHQGAKPRTRPLKA